MRILLTGAFGNVGLSVIDELKARGHETHLFDLRNKNNKKYKRNLKKSIAELTWGDIRNNDAIERAAYACDCIIHLAAIVPPMSEKNEKTCYEINIKGTENVIKAASAAKKRIPVIYVSSASIIGPTQSQDPPVNTSTPDKPLTFYAKSKSEAEKLIKESGLDYCILRLASVLDSGADYQDNMLELLFEFPLDARNEVILDSDAAAAIVNAAEKVLESDVNKKMYYIGGGSLNGCQITNRILLEGMFTAMGIGMLSEDCFNKDLSNFPMDWYDTKESNRVLDYQYHSFGDYIKIIEKKTESGGFFVKVMAPRLKNTMEMQSPYFKNAHKEK